MPTKEDLLQAIETCKSEESSVQSCQKLAIFYYLYDRLYGKLNTEYDSDSEFMRIAKNMDLSELMAKIDELVETIRVLDHKLYESFMSNL